MELLIVIAETAAAGPETARSAAAASPAGGAARTRGPHSNGHLPGVRPLSAGRAPAAPGLRQRRPSGPAGSPGEPGAMTFSHRVLRDHLVPGPDQAEGGGDVADPAEAGRDVPEGSPALSRRAEPRPPRQPSKRGGTSRVRVSASGPRRRRAFHRGVAAVTCAAMPGAGQHQQSFQHGRTQNQQKYLVIDLINNFS